MFTYQGIKIYFGKVGNTYQIRPVMENPGSKTTMELNGKPVDFVISGDGKLTVGGKPVTLLPSTDTSGEYPVGAGWRMFTYHGIKIYFGKVGNTYQIRPVMENPGSTMTLDINGKKINMEISGDGKITIGGQPVTLLPSTDTSGKHSAAAGWRMFTYMG